MQPVDIFTLQDADTYDGLFMITDYSKKLDPASKAPLTGKVTYKGKTMTFKIWDTAIQNAFNSSDLTGIIIQAKGSTGKYRDNLELTFTSVTFDHGFTDRNVFYKSADIPAVYNRFVSFVNGNFSPSAVTVMQNVFQQANLFDPFKFTWAAKKMHDAQVGGLMNHTTKMLHLAKTLVDNDSRLSQYMDLIYLSIVFHDMGKIVEYTEGGVFTKYAFAGHRTFGVEILVNHKSSITDVYGEGFFYRMLDVVTGHHGEFGDKPQTIHGYIVHLIDMLDAHVTGFLDRVEVNEITEKDGNKTVWADGRTLTI